MRVVPALTATILLGSAAILAQVGATPIRWAEGAPNATSEVKNDAKIEGLKTDDVQIYVSLAELKETEYNRVWVQIFNHSKAPVAVDPQSAILLTEKDKTIRAEVPDKAANSIQKYGEAKSQELSSAHCSNMIATQCQPTPSQMQVAKQVAAYSSQQAQWIKDNALVQKNLAPGEDTQGYIVFKKEKKKANYVLKLTVGTQAFEFPVAADNKAPSFAD
jgi:hypothetical protein